MNALLSGCHQRSSSTAALLRTTQASSRPTIQCSSRLIGRDFARGDDHHVLHRHIVMTATPTGLHRGDLIHDIHAVHDLAEYGITIGAGLVIEELIVLEVDEELRGGAVDVVGARHRQAAALVLHAIGCLVLDGGVIGFLAHVRRHPAALDHEAGDDPVENEAIEKFLAHIALEILDRDRRFLVQKLDGEIAERGLESDHGKLPLARWRDLQVHWPSVTRSWPARSRCERTLPKPRATSSRATALPWVAPCSSASHPPGIRCSGAAWMMARRSASASAPGVNACRGSSWRARSAGSWAST